jgi:hypothetical protein
MTQSLPYKSIHELHYQTWIIAAGSKTFIYTGDKAGLKSAIEWVRDKRPSMRPRVKKVN